MYACILEETQVLKDFYYDSWFYPKFRPKVLFILQREPYFETLVLLTQKTRRFDSTDYFH